MENDDVAGAPPLADLQSIDSDDDNDAEREEALLDSNLSKLAEIADEIAILQSAPCLNPSDCDATVIAEAERADLISQGLLDPHAPPVDVLPEDIYNLDLNIHDSNIDNVPLTDQMLSMLQRNSLLQDAYRCVRCALIACVAMAKKQQGDPPTIEDVASAIATMMQQTGSADLARMEFEDDQSGRRTWLAQYTMQAVVIHVKVSQINNQFLPRIMVARRKKKR